jgi:hypothetical protein
MFSCISAGVKNMSFASGIPAPVNGLPRRPAEVNEAIEYEKIIGIYHQVIAGNHPRLRLSGHVNAQPQPNLDHHSSQVPVPTLVPSVSEPAPPAALTGLQLSNNVQALASKPTIPSGSSLSSKKVPSKPPVSELDPIFLTKSDDLVRAEIQLQRQRVERALREQVEQKRIDARHKPSFPEAKPEFDVADVLTKALTIVKPIVLDEAHGVNENGSATDSFDENSFYSSKAPDSTPNDGEGSQKSSVSKHQVQPVNDDELDADGLVDRRSDEMQQVDLPDSPYRVIPRPDYSNVPNAHYRRDAVRERDAPVTLARAALDEDDDEPEYSPPEPTQLAHLKDGKDVNVSESWPERVRNVNGKHTNHYQNAKRYGSPTDADVRVVRSHITSPIAPQPSRVSPLAVAKGPPFSQNRRHRQSYGQQRRLGEGEQGRASTDMAISSAQPRKKRKVQEVRRGTRRRVNGSPDPVIKEEPVSPPPFHDVPPLGAARNRPAAGRPIYIDVETPQDVRRVPEPHHEALGRQVIYDVEDQTPHSAPRVLSRAGLKDGPRPNQDLRRVVSVQNLPPREYADPPYQTPARLSRAPSYAAIDGPSRNNEARPFEGQPQVYERPQIVEEMPLLSPAFRDVEAGHRFAVPSMAPPPQRRIVMDEYGQRFYETIQPARASIAPAPVRRVDVDSYNDVAISRNAISRAASVLEEPYREARYIQQEMAPPQMIYRRVAELPRPATSDLRYVAEASRPISSDIRYITREPIEARPTQRSGSLQMYDYPVRQSAYIDDSMASREPLVRVSSVRPMARPPYEEPQEVLQRVQSVRPEAREFDVIPEERHQARREVMQVETPHYEVRRAADGERYYRIDEAGRMMLDGAVETRSSYAPRY